MTRLAFVMAGALAALPVAAAHAQSQPRALHNIPWYSAHPSERAATLRLCHSDYSYSNMPDCANAEAGAAGQVSSGSSIGKLRAMLNDPEYWRENPIARNAARFQCQRRAPIDADVIPYCSAIEAGGR